MIEKTDALRVFQANMDRTNMLIQAIDKIRAYNFLYQEKSYEISAEYASVVKNIQDKELVKIEKSCIEHAIISLTTAFETYYKELIQDLLFNFPNYFQSKQTKYTKKIVELIRSDGKNDYESICEKLNLKNRFHFLRFFQLYDVEFLTEEEKEFIEYIYIKRNNFVHNAGKINEKLKLKLNKNSFFIQKSHSDESIKRLRTRMNRLIPKAHKRIFCKMK